MSPESLQAIATALLSITSAAFVVRLARSQLLSFRYTAGWLSLLLLTALSGILLPTFGPLAKSLSTTPGVLVSGMAILILVLICIQLSVSISGLQKQVQSLSEDLALHKIDQEVSEATNRNSILLP